MRFNTMLLNAEVRRVVAGTNRKTGEAQYTLRVENGEDGEPLEVSCRDKNLFHAVQGLKRGDIVDLPVLVMANSQYQFIALTNAPVLCEDED